LNLAGAAIRSTDDLVLKDQTGGRAVREQTAIGIRNSTFGCSNAAAATQNDAFGLDQTGLRGDGP
jgi:hypothetical protein